MSGLLEILLIVAILLAILLLPRLSGKKPQPSPAQGEGRTEISGWMRAAILGSILWISLAGFYFKPWNGPWVSFCYVGVGPVALIWGVYWVFSGFERNKR